MSWLQQFFRSSIGSKYVMAVTGILLLGFVIGHLVGNLQAFPWFGGRAGFNGYAEFLKQHPGITWPVRIVLLVIFGLHVATGIRLARANRAARPSRYAAETTIQASYASRSMVLTGLVTLAYLVYHLLHFTFGVTNPEHHASREVLAGGASRHDVYVMLVKGFQSPGIAAAYLVAMVLLGLHLSHGVSSFWQSLGLHHGRYTPWLRRLGPVVGIVIAAAYISIPVSVWLGIIALPQGGK